MRVALEVTPAAARDEDGPVPDRALGIGVDTFGLFTTPATLAVDASAFAERKLAALRCHRSQIAGDLLDRLPDEAAASVLGLELYRRADVGARGETFVDRLGLPADSRD
jgi:hypothetical protein